MNFKDLNTLPPPNNIAVSNPKIQNKLDISWDSVNTAIGYNIYKGTSINGIFYKLNDNLVLTNKYEDSIGINIQASYYYKISSVDAYNNEGNLSEPVMFEIKTGNYWYRKMNDRNFWILKQTGQVFDLYTRKIEGKICECTSRNRTRDLVRDRDRDRDGTIDSQILMAPNNSSTNCTKCFGTGFVDGYDPKFRLWVRLKSASQKVELDQQGYVNQHAPGAWTITPIKLKNRDILIDQQNRRFSILDVQVGNAGGYLFHHELNLKEIETTDIIYKLNTKNLQPFDQK